MSTKQPKTAATPKTDERDAIIARQAERLRELSRMIEERDSMIKDQRKDNMFLACSLNDVKRSLFVTEGYMIRSDERQRKECSELNTRLVCLRRRFGLAMIITCVLTLYGFVMSLFAFA